MPTTQKFTTAKTGPENQKPVAVLAVQRIDAVIGSIIQLDGRGSFDPDGTTVRHSWRFVQLPIGSALTDTSFRDIRPNGTAVSFIPDKTGQYVVELIVNDGELDSDPVTAVINIQFSRVPCGEGIVPDAQFLWSYISNFWLLVEDREKITTIWSSVIQNIGSELIKLWEADRNKSLKTIQTKFQRRWVEFPATTDLRSQFDQRIIAGKTDSGTGAATGNIGEVPGTGNTSVIYLPLGSVGDITATDFTNLEGRYGPQGRVIVVNGETYTISRVLNKTVGAQDWTLALVDEEVIPEGQAGVGWRIPHLLHTPGLDLEEDGVRAGDILVLEVTRNDIGLTAELRCQVTGSDRERVGFEFSLDPLTIPRRGSGASANQVGNNRRLTGLGEGAVTEYDIGREIKILNGDHPGKYTIVSVVGTDTVEFEFLPPAGSDSSNPNLEWEITGGQNISRSSVSQLMRDLRIVPPAAADETATAFGEAFIAWLPVSINLKNRPFSRFQVTFSAKEIIHNSVLAGDEDLISAPALQEQIKDPPVILRENLDYFVTDDGDLQFVGNLFTLTDPAPPTFWAECVYFDNDQIIEDNFGRLVELGKDDLTNLETRLPYLSAVKGLFYAFTNGPSVANIRLALQILLGLPFMEERGTILEIDESFSVDSEGNPLGRILVEDNDEQDGLTGIRRFYFYSPEVGLETNPSTGEPYAVGETLEQFTPLTKGVLVEDYLKTPRWWDAALTGLEVLKYFNFHVVVASEIFDSNDVAFAIDFVKKLKPAYTNLIFNVLRDLEEDIEVEDDFVMNILLRFYDNTWGLEATNRADDYNHQGATLFRVGSRPFSTRIPKMLRDVQTERPSGNLVVNGNFSAWTADDPDSWSVATGTGGDVTERGFDQGNTGGGSGSCNLLKGTVGNAIIQQTITVVNGQTYDLIFDIGYVSSGAVVRAASPWFGENFTTTGRKVVTFTALGTSLALQFNTGICPVGEDFTIDNARLVESVVEVTSATGWDVNAIRGRDDTTDPVIEGDHLYLHPGQPGAGFDVPGIYEIGSVIDANTLRLLTRASGPDPETYQTGLLDPSTVMFGSGLTCTILRRETNPVLKGLDLSTSSVSNDATSPGAYFLTNGVSIGDHLIIEGGSNQGEYYITELTTPPDTYISETQVGLRNLDGSAPTFSDLASQSFRVIRPIMAPKRFEGAWSKYNAGAARMEIEVPDPDLTSSLPFDVFTPAMVGAVINVAQSQAGAVNDGNFQITQYLGPGKVAINSASTTSDTSPESVISFP